MKNRLTRQPIVISLIRNFSALWFENISFSLSWFHHLHDPETHLKIPKNCLIWEKKTINPKLQLACFSLVHIKMQWNGTFHPKNVRLKDDFKRRICDCEFSIAVRTETKSWNPKYWLREQDISSYHWVTFCPNPKPKSKVNNFHLLFFSSFLWNGAHQWFWSRSWLKLLCWVVGTILFPNKHMTYKSYWIQMELTTYPVVSCIVILGTVS